MTAKEQLRGRIETLTEHEAERTLRLLDDLREDPVIAAFRDAPEDDEPWTEQDEAALQESRVEYRRGEGVALDEVRHEFELDHDARASIVPRVLPRGRAYRD